VLPLAAERDWRRPNQNPPTPTNRESKTASREFIFISLGRWKIGTAQIGSRSKIVQREKRIRGLVSANYTNFCE
jgi:hypothetical protein